MAHHSTVFSQILRLVPRHEFEGLARRHHHGRQLRRMSRWNQFVALMVGQLTGRSSLRDVVANLHAQARKLYHLGVRGMVARTSLARVNEQQPASLYEALFGQLLERCRQQAPRHGFRFKNPLYSLDATVIDLCLGVFPWATFRATKGAIKLHVGLDHGGYLPSFVAVTEGDRHEIQWARTLRLPRGSMVVFDRGFVDHEWWKQLDSKGISFVTRLKAKATYAVLERRRVRPGTGLTSDQTILLGAEAPIKLRRIGYRDAATGRHLVFVTNAFHLSAVTVASLYRERWQIELFFKWIKQNLKIRAFLGTSKNAVLTQIWIALCAYLLLAFIKFSNQLTRPLSRLLQLLQLNLFERRALVRLLQAEPDDTSGRFTPDQTSLAFR